MKYFCLPLLLFAVPALVFAWIPAARDFLLLDRVAVQSGQAWRLWTGHWIHFSGPHLAWNLAVVLVAGAWLEHTRPGRLLPGTLIAAPLISASILGLEPALAAYGGLSGLATALIVLLALDQMHTSRTGRWYWLGTLVLVTAKLMGESADDGGGLFVNFECRGVRTSSVAHAVGAACGAMAYVILAERASRLLPRWRV